MAEFRVTAQNLNIPVPDVGEVFRWGDMVMKREGNSIIQLGNQYSDPAIQQLYKSVPHYAEANVLWERGGVNLNPNPVGVSGISGFQQGKPAQTGEIITQTNRPDNPNAPIVTSSTRGTIFEGNPLPQGVTPLGQKGAGGLPLYATPGSTLPQVFKQPALGQPDIKKLLEEGNRIGAAASKLSGVPFTPSAITSGMLAKTQAPVVAKIPPTFVPSVASISTEFGEKKAGSLDPFTQKLDELSAQLERRSQETVNRMGEATATYEKELLEINKQIKEKQADALALEKRAEQRAIPMPFIDQEIALGKKQLTIDVLRLSAIAESLQGNISLAEKRTQRAIDVEFADIEKQIKTTRNNIIANYDSFTSEEQKRADITLLQINSNDAFIQAKKAERKEIGTLVTNAIKDGIRDLKVLEQAQNADSIDEAQRIIAANLPKKELTGQSGFEQAFLRDKGRLPTVDEILDFEKKRGEAGRKGDDPNRILTPTEAQALGVPYGTTAQTAYGKTPLTTIEGRTDAAVSKYAMAFVPGAKLKSGLTILGADGFIDPRAWKQAIADAPAEGLSRKEFITQFGYLINTQDEKSIKEYGLTPAEIKLIQGILPQ